MVGLTSAEADASQRRFGANTLPAPQRPSLWRRVVEQLVHFFAIMLWCAAALALLAGMPQLSIAVVAVVVLNATFSLIQEGRADRASERLASLLPVKVSAVRDGRVRQIDAADVVVGDVVVLQPGDRVPADGVIRRATALSLDTSMLTGESASTHPEADDEVFAGTFVTEGEGSMVVASVGVATRLAGISALTSRAPKPDTPLAVELRKVVRLIAIIALGIGALFFGLTLLLGNPTTDGFIFAVGVTVALVPEALLPTVTLTLAWGAEQMAKRQVLVRRLESVETLGSTTFICTDKTGTLTRNEMTVVEAWSRNSRAVVAQAGYAPDASVDVEGDIESMITLARGAVGCSDGYVLLINGMWVPHGDPMEGAIDAFARRLGVETDSIRVAEGAAHRFPFDPRRRRMSVVFDDEILVKGAPDSVLPLCEANPAADEAVAALTNRGLRVLAVARRQISESTTESVADVEKDLLLLGLLGLEDPPRDDVQEALESCRRAGIKVAMVTGDHPVTARSIATEVGLRSEGDPVLLGSELPADEEILGALLDHSGIVIARVSPEEKLRIANALRRRGHVLAMTGDGVNDVPALHAANIGIAMGKSGSDIAREAADFILLDDHFASIVAGIDQGRATFVNIRRFLTYHLTDNVAELAPFVVWAVSGGRFPLALGVLQILALDIGTDTFSAVALGAEPPSKRLLDGPPVTGRLMNGTVLRRAFGVIGPTEAAMSMLAFVVTLLAAGWRPGGELPDSGVLAAASGAAFISVVFAQAANGFACRSAVQSPWSLGWTSNRLLLVATLFGMSFSLLILLVPAIAHVFGQSNPWLIGWAAAVAAPVAVLVIDAIDKSIRRRALTRRELATAPLPIRQSAVARIR